MMRYIFLLIIVASLLSCQQTAHKNGTTIDTLFLADTSEYGDITRYLIIDGDTVKTPFHFAHRSIRIGESWWGADDSTIKYEETLAQLKKIIPYYHNVATDSSLYFSFPDHFIDTSAFLVDRRKLKDTLSSLPAETHSNTIIALALDYSNLSRDFENALDGYYEYSDSYSEKTSINKKILWTLLDSDQDSISFPKGTQIPMVMIGFRRK